MFQVRVMSVEEYGFAVDLANGMNWSMSFEDFRFSQFLEPDGCFVLFDDSVPVGVATCVSFGRVGWFGNFVVKPECRGRGGGRFLLKYVVDYLLGRGVETVGLYAYLHLRDFYGEFGFKADLGLSVMYNDHVQVDGLVCSDLVLESCVDFAGLSCFDSEFFGGDRSRLLRGVFSGRGNFCYVFREGQVVVGYVLVKVPIDSEVGVVEVGPLVCCCDRLDVVLELLKAVLLRLSGRRVFLYLFEGQGVVEEFLLGLGFRKEFSLLRMFLGDSKIQKGMCLAESLERG